ncbi:D-alanyl-D-alanine carboxypeptidase/D-alanyl-D-alanine endopeptidase [Corynebacterium sp. 335C]
MKRTVAWAASIVVFAMVVTAVVVVGLRGVLGVEVAPAPAVQPAPAALAPLGPEEGGAGSGDGDGDDAAAAGGSGVPDAEMRDAVSAILGPALAGPGMGTTVGVVSDAATGQVLWDGGADVPATPASSTKILTAAAALLTLDPAAVQTTRVIAGANPGEVILQGSGDQTLSRDGEGSYPGAASMADLSAQVRRALGGQGVTTVLVDASGAADRYHPSWDRAGIAEGYIAPIEPVSVDAGRATPTSLPRSATPALDAGRALAEDLGAADVAETTAAPAEGAVLGEVTSAPLLTRVPQMLVHSDNVMAEQIGREVAAATGRPATFRGAADAVVAVLAEHGLAVDGGASLQDVSGLSPDNRIRPAQLDRVLRAAAGDAGAVQGEEADAGHVTSVLSHLVDGLPVAAVSGTLADRYLAGNPGAGWVRAKTGTLDGVSALSGVLATDGGRVLTFTLLSNDADVAAARAGADAALGRIREL